MNRWSKMIAMHVVEVRGSAAIGHHGDLYFAENVSYLLSGYRAGRLDALDMLIKIPARAIYDGVFRQAGRAKEVEKARLLTHRLVEEFLADNELASATAGGCWYVRTALDDEERVKRLRRCSLAELEQHLVEALSASADASNADVPDPRFGFCEPRSETAEYLFWVRSEQDILGSFDRVAMAGAQPTRPLLPPAQSSPLQGLDVEALIDMKAELLAAYPGVLKDMPHCPCDEDSPIGGYIETLKAIMPVLLIDGEIIDSDDVIEEVARSDRWALWQIVVDVRVFFCAINDAAHVVREKAMLKCT